jgi:WD40 repeat protein
LEIRRHLEGFSLRLSTPNAQASKPVAGVVKRAFGQAENLSVQIFQRIDARNLKGEVERESESLVELGRNLFEAAFPPEVAGTIRASDSEFLVLDLDNESNRIPWELVHDGSDFLCCRFSVGRRVQSWEYPESIRRKRPTDRSTAFIVSNPTGDLKEASQEGATLADLLENHGDVDVTWLNNRTSLRNLCSWFTKTDLLHFSGHSTNGAADDEKPGWELTDSRFTEDEIRRIKERGENFPLLIFSNSCGSGETPGEYRKGGHATLAESFLRLGCPHYVGVYSKVIDRFGSEFAQRFYQYVLNRGAIGTSMRLARLEIRSKQESDHLTWAQYVLYGDPSTSLFGERAFFPEVHTLLFASTGDPSSLKESLFENLISTFPDCESIQLPEHGLCIAFPRPSEAVRFSLSLHENGRRKGRDSGIRVAISSGEALVERQEGSEALLGVTGLPFETGKALLQIASERQTLATRPVFDNARAMLRGNKIPGIRNVSWLDHGAYLFSGFDEPIGICEVGEKALAPLTPPPDSELAHRFVPSDQEPVLGWRPALDLEIPTSPRWVLIEKLGEGGFGEVWRAKHKHSGATRVFKFCFKADRVRSLKREATLFRLLRESIGDHPGIVQVLNTYFEEPPYYIEMEDVPGENLGQWILSHGGPDKVPSEVRLEIVAQTAEALQAAHDSGVLHRDVKPSNILVVGSPDDPKGLRIKLSDFGIGQVQEKSLLGDFTAGGFTETFSATELASGSGTRLYMAPELLIGKPSSTRSDVFSLGVVLYQLLVGDLGRPLASDWREEIEDPLLAQDLEVCLTGEPGKRLNAVGDLAGRLRSLEERRAERIEKEMAEKRRTRNRFVASVASVGVVVVLLIAVALGFGLVRESRARDAAEREAYYSTVALAQKTIEEGKVGTAETMLLGTPERFRNWEWGWLFRLCNLDRASYALPASSPSNFEISPEGRSMAICSGDGSVSILDLETGEIGFEVSLLTARSAEVAFDPTGKIFAAAVRSDLMVYDLESRSQIAHYGLPGISGFGGPLCFHPIEKILGARLYDPKISFRFWDLESGQVVLEIQSGEEAYSDYQFDREGDRVLFSSERGTARIWDFASKKEVLVYRSRDPINSSVFSPNGEYVASCATERPVRIWESTTGANVAISPFTGSSAVFFSDGNTLLVRSGKSIIIWDWKKNRILDEAGIGPGAIKLDPSEKKIWILDDAKQIKAIPLPLPHAEIPLRGPLEGVNRCEFTPDGKRLIGAGREGSLTVWSASAGSEFGFFNIYDTIYALDLSRDGSKALIGMHGGDLGWSGIVDLQSGQMLTEFLGQRMAILSVAFSPSENLVATGGATQTIYLWDAKSGARLQDLAGHSDVINDVIWSRDGAKLFSSSRDRTVRIWDTTNGAQIGSISGTYGEVGRLELGPLGNKLIGACSDFTARVWGGDSYEEIFSFRHSGVVHSARFTPDGKRIITSSDPNTLTIWDAQTGRQVLSLANTFQNFAISPDGRTVAGVGDPGRCRLLNAFPWKDSDYPGDPAEPLIDRIEEYNRDYWKRFPPRSLDSLKLGEVEPATGVTGYWDFEDGNLTARIGCPLEYFYDYPSQTESESKTRFGTCSDFHIAKIGAVDVGVLAFEDFDMDCGYRLFSGALANGGGKQVNRYTLLMDLYLPKSTDGRVIPIFNANPHNRNLPELEITGNGGLGVDGTYFGDFKRGEWRRLVCVIDLSTTLEPTMTTYLNGDLVGVHHLPSTVDGRWATHQGTRAQPLLLFAGWEEGGVSGYVSAVQFRNYPLSAEEVRALGGPSADGIPWQEGSQF